MNKAPDQQTTTADRRSFAEGRTVEHRSRIEILRRYSERLAVVRLTLFAVVAIMAWIAWVSLKFSGWWVLAPLVGFVGAIAIHDRVIKHRSRHERAAGYWDGVSRRIDRQWGFGADEGSRFADAKHPYAEDLEIFGVRSVFAFVAGQSSVTGGATLAQWLLAPSPIESVRRRQLAIAELVPRVDLREDLAVIERPVAGRSPLEKGAAIFARVPETISLATAMGLAVLAILNLATLYGWLLAGWGPTPFVLALILSGGAHLALGRPIEQGLEDVEILTEGLHSVSSVLARLETERFDTDLLADLVSRLGSDSQSASVVIARLDRLLALLDSARNQLFMPIAAMMHWRAFCAVAIGRWRRRHGPSAAAWVATLGEIEALVSLASFAWMNPDYVFPRFVAGDARVDATDLGHPLLPLDSVVRNDVRLGGETRILVVSGSNMSGKSTLLRSIGVNVVLANTGAPVCARSFFISPLHVGASIVVRDSLHEGRSRFYAEISRIRNLVGIAETTPPLLFLIDEVLHGTNSHDRRIGSSAILHGLVERGAIGLITTHDLAIAEVVEELGGRGRNVHFEDQIKDGVMSFDYRLRDGVVRRSNALELMRSIGLEV